MILSLDVVLGALSISDLDLRSVIVKPRDEELVDSSVNGDEVLSIEGGATKSSDVVLTEATELCDGVSTSFVDSIPENSASMTCPDTVLELPEMNVVTAKLFDSPPKVVRELVPGISLPDEDKALSPSIDEAKELALAASEVVGVGAGKDL